MNPIFEARSIAEQIARMDNVEHQEALRGDVKPTEAKRTDIGEPVDEAVCRALLEATEPDDTLPKVEQTSQVPPTLEQIEAARKYLRFYLDRCYVIGDVRKALDTLLTMPDSIVQNNLAALRARVAELETAVTLRDSALKTKDHYIELANRSVALADKMLAEKDAELNAPLLAAHADPWPFDGETPHETVARLMRERNDAVNALERVMAEAGAPCRHDADGDNRLP